ncbi:MAG: hypothetical protein BGO12_23655 [Verrucomicrobia bacterium 61-8]|nr:DUF1844 domain-containing protein [Verrucomicrobiota bacterium]OJV04222.1 MAG: hypothetical protein BGO12_23655 [Verrucomicrobia bacterium 61-8]
MAEVQTSTQAGALTQRFIEFVVMQAQQASLFLGRFPHPQTGKTEVHLEAARLFIDQLEMIREKTRGNLSPEETEILQNVLSDLQMAFVQATNEASAGGAAPAPETASAGPAPEAAAPDDGDEESKKRFSKSYGS